MAARPNSLRAYGTASWAIPQAKQRGTGLPVAKRRDSNCRAVLFAHFLARQKVSRLPGRDPASVAGGNIEAILIAACACCDGT